jgi:hypothetical protein
MASEYGRDWSYKPASFGVEMDIQYIATSHSSPMRQFSTKASSDSSFKPSLFSASPVKYYTRVPGINLQGQI